MKSKEEGFFESLAKTRQSLTSRFGLIFNTQHDQDMWEHLEEALISSDIGMDLVEQLITLCREKARKARITDKKKLIDLIKNELMNISRVQVTPSIKGHPEIYIMVGVNGSGKTTTIAKLAKKKKSEGIKVMLVAADTFRDAAIEQLDYWAQLLSVDIVYNRQSTDPASVVYDGIQSAIAKDMDVLIVDTAGRLQTQTNLMNELNKIRSVIDGNSKGASVNCFLVVDATTGQNGISQTKEFIEAASVDGVIISKIDGSSKGGIALAIQNRFKIPVRYLGVGEKEDDLLEFDHRMFVEALFE
jgi:fused signal recognition particle receptor